MVKQEILDNIASKQNVDVDIVQSVISQFIDEIKNRLIHGEHVVVCGFGTFYSSKRSYLRPEWNSEMPTFKPFKGFIEDFNCGKSLCTTKP